MKWLTRLIFLLALFPQLTIAQAQAKLKAPDYLLRLDSKKDFDLMKGEPLSKNFNGIECVKIIYEIQSKTLYYANSRRYLWHYPFVKKVLNDPDDLPEFNQKNYNPTNRKYILGTFNYNSITGNYFLEFAVCDNPSDAQIDELVEKVKATFFLGAKFKILLNTTILLRRKTEIAARHQVLSSNDLFKSRSYQPICQGRASGIFKMVRAEDLAKNEDYSQCILIVDGTPNDLPLCRGLITTAFQTPLSHICLLTNNRHTPCAAQKTILIHDSLEAWKNKMVLIEVSAEKVTIQRSTLTEQNTKKLSYIRCLKSDTITRTVANLNRLEYKDKKTYGSKVANLAELKRIKHKGKPLYTPENAFAIPFYYYVQHASASGADTLVSKLDKLADSNAVKLLKLIRYRIKNHPLDTTFLALVTKQCLASFGKTKIRFRSSSNCEDEDNFNGAGLYSSTSAHFGDSSKTIEGAIKKVWASLWLLRAYRERKFFNFDERSVAMAVLVHQAFDNEEVNGVAITKNLYRNYDFGFVLNMQKGEEEVVSPKPGLVCEQVITYMDNSAVELYNSSNAADWICYSSLNPSSSLLSTEELKELSAQLESIKQHFFKVYKIWPLTLPRNFAVDVEFKIMRDKNNKRIILFKQARPYH